MNDNNLSASDLDELANIRPTRTRTSPRVNVINEVQALIQTHTNRIATVLGEAQAQGVEGTLVDLVGGILAELSTEVDKLKEVHSKKSSQRHNLNAGAHVGVFADGTVKVVKDGDPVVNLVKVYGPFRTAPGAQYAIDHDTYTNHPMQEMD